jgi:diacylglycerol kinase family enzyme
MKNLLGHSAYIIEALKTFGTIMDSHHFEIERDNGQMIEGNFIYGMITNSISVGGFRGITGKNIVLDDGLFEVILIKKPKNALELQDIVTCLLTRKSCKNIVAFKTSKLRLVSDEKVKWVLDGEFGGSQKNVVIRNYKCAVKVITGFESTKKQKIAKFFRQSSLHDC